MPVQLCNSYTTTHLQNQIGFISGPVADRLLRTLLERLALCVKPPGHSLSMDPACVIDLGPVDPRRREHRTQKRAQIVFVRQVAMYLCHVVLGVNLTGVGRIFRRHRRTAAYACRIVEDARDDRTFDRTLEVLEAATRMAAWRTYRLTDLERA